MTTLSRPRSVPKHTIPILAALGSAFMVLSGVSGLASLVAMIGGVA
jgi:hypothetical protein